MWTKSVIYFDSDSGSSGGPERIHTERRRRPGASQGPRQTAQGPERDRPSSTGSSGGGFSTGGGGSSFPGGTRGKQVGGGSLLLIILCVVGYLIMGGNLGDLLGGATGTTSDPIATIDQGNDPGSNQGACGG